MKPRREREVGNTNRSRVESISRGLHTYGNEETTKLEDVLAESGVFLPLSSYIAHKKRLWYLGNVCTSRILHLMKMWTTRM
jgi:hypothetical protein